MLGNTFKDLFENSVLNNFDRKYLAWFLSTSDQTNLPVMIKIGHIPKGQYWNYFILVSRILLAWTFLSYGVGKLVDGQFGISQEELSRPVNGLSLFKLSWFLFNHQPFKLFVGISQIICALLLVFKRTELLGALMFIPIATTILIIDLTIMPHQMGVSFTWRLLFYLLLNFLILLHHKPKLLIIGQIILQKVTLNNPFPLWAYLVLPFMVIFLEIFGALPKFIIALVKRPDEVYEGINRFMLLLF